MVTVGRTIDKVLSQPPQSSLPSHVTCYPPRQPPTLCHDSDTNNDPNFTSPFRREKETTLCRGYLAWSTGGPTTRLTPLYSLWPTSLTMALVLPPALGGGRGLGMGGGG